MKIRFLALFVWCTMCICPAPTLSMTSTQAHNNTSKFLIDIMRSTKPTKEEIALFNNTLTKEKNNIALDYAVDGETLLHWAALNKDSHFLEILLAELSPKQLATTINLKNKLGQTPLYLAVERHAQETIMALINAGAHIDTTTLKNDTPVNHAAASGNPKAMDTLLRAGANPNIKNDYGADLMASIEFYKKQPTANAHIMKELSQIANNQLAAQKTAQLVGIQKTVAPISWWQSALSLVGLGGQAESEFFVEEAAQPKTVFVARADFVKEILGIDEATFKKDDDLIRLAIKKEGDTFYIKNSATKERYKAGNFVLKTIAELRAATTKKLIGTTSLNNGTFNVLVGYNPTQKPAHLARVDVGAQQADPNNHDAVFQVASNFNALETTSKYNVPNTITNYIYDPTQGPAASISAAPGTILRHYYAFYPKGTPDEWQQRQEPHQIHLLEDVATLFPTQNGYVVFDDKNLAIDISNKQDSIVQQMKVCIHNNIQVTYGFKRDNDSHALVNNPHQTVHQVFAAGVDFGGANAQYAKNSAAIERAKLVLQAAYEGILYAAYTNNKKKVFLTLVGMGVFENKFSWLPEIFSKKITLGDSNITLTEFIQKSGLEVTMVIFDAASNFKKADFDPLLHSLASMSEKTNGAFEWINAPKELQKKYLVP